MHAFDNGAAQRQQAEWKARLAEAEKASDQKQEVSNGK